MKPTAARQLTLLMLGALLTLLLAAALPAPQPAAAARGIYAPDYNVDLELRPDGSMIAAETFHLRFEGGPFTRISRELPTTRTDGIVFYSAGLDGQPLPVGTDPGSVEIELGSPLRVTWHLTPTQNVTHTFTLVYQVAGVIEKTNDFDLLNWNALPTTRDYAIGTTRVLITYPREARLALDPGLNRGEAQIKIEPGSIVYRAADLPAAAPLDLSLRFVSNSLTPVIPDWQADFWQRRQMLVAGMPLGVTVGTFTLLLGVIWLYLLWNRSRLEGRGPERHAEPLFVQDTPPSELPPAIGAALITHGGRINNQQALGTLFDLASRGLVTIREQPPRHWYQSRTFILELQPTPTAAAGDRFTHLLELRPWERGLLQALFVTRAGQRPELPVSDLAGAIAANWRAFAHPLEAALRADRLIDPRRRRLGTVTTLLGLLLLFGGLAGVAGLVGVILPTVQTIDSRFHLTVALLGTAIAVILIGAAAIVVGASLPVLSRRGAQFSSRWRAFAAYLRAITRSPEGTTAPDLFERYLPYAVAYGLGKPWVRHFRTLAHANAPLTVPAWFQAINPASAEAALGAFLAMLGSAEASIVAADTPRTT